MEIRLVEGWTGNIDMQLLADGVSVDLTGCAIALILRGRDGVAVDTAGDIAAIDESAGTVRYAPDGADLTVAKSPFSARWQVTDSIGKVVFFPNGPADRWLVSRP